MNDVCTGSMAIGGVVRTILGCSPFKETGNALPLEGVDEDTHFHDASLGLT